MLGRRPFPAPMAANNIKCRVLIASIVLFISIAQANYTFKANTLTKIHQADSEKSETQTFGLQQKARLENSVVTSFKETKTINSLQSRKHGSHINFHGLRHKHSAMPTARAFKHAKKQINKLSFRHKLKSGLRDSKMPKHVINNYHPKHNSEKSNQLKYTRKQSKKAGKPWNPLGRAMKDDASETKHPDGGCWAAVHGDVDNFFKIMDKLNEKYKTAMNAFVKEIGGPLFDKEMYEVMLSNRSVSERALFDAGGVSAAVPAGLQLGGYAVLEDVDSLIFFHRLKLRNKTSFCLRPIHNDMADMILNAELNLGDLHLAGNYERLKVDRLNPGNLYYAPTYGSLDFLLRDVKFKIQGRYRVANSRLLIEQVISNITGKDALMIYTELPRVKVKMPNPIVKFNKFEDFVDRLKIDLNQWVKDYFNDYLTYFGLASKRVNADFQSYDKQKTMIHNDFVDHIVRLIRWKLVAILTHIEPYKSSNVSRLFNLPDFTITTLNGMTLKCTKGLVQGLNSIYRRSTATGPSFAKYALMRQVDAVVGFSALKVVYRYEATTSEGPPMQGQLILTANDLTAHMALHFFRKDPAIYVHFDQIHPMKVQTLTIEGPVNEMIGSFKHVLENHIIALLVNILMDQVKELDNIFKCPGYENQALEPPPKMKSLDDIGPNDQNNHLDPEIDNNDADVHNGDANKDPGLPDGDAHVEPDGQDGDYNEDPELPAGDAPVEPDEQDGNFNEDPKLPAGDGPVEPDRQDGDYHEDPRLPAGDDHGAPDGQVGDINEDPGLPAGDDHGAPDGQDGDYNEDPRLPTGDTQVEPDAPGDANGDQGDIVTNPEAPDGNNEQLLPEEPVLNSVKPDLILEKSDSVELELPKDTEHNKARQVHVEVKEQFKLFERKDEQPLRRHVGRQEIAKKGGKNSRSELLLFR